MDHGGHVAAGPQRVDGVEAVEQRQQLGLQVGRVRQENGPRFRQLENLEVE